MGKRKNSIYVNFDNIADVNKFISKVVRELTANYANNPGITGPIVYGFSVRIDNRGSMQDPNQGRLQGTGQEPAKEPLIDIINRPGSISVLAELPGMDKRSLVMASDHSKLRISCTWSGGIYTRSVTLPNSVNPKSASATYNNGVLEIMFEKSASVSNEMKIMLN